MADTAVVTATATPFVAPKLVRKFSHAAAGHEGVLRDDSGMLVIKPCLPKEVAFYESSVAHHPELAFWMPTFMGTLQLNETNTLSVDNVPSSSPPPPAAAATTTITSDTTTAIPKTLLPISIVLENLTHPFVQPCVLDIKLGAQLWDDSAPLSKRERLDAVAASTTSKPLGLRIAGMKVWKGEKDGYQIYDKQYGRQFTPENVIDGFREFLSGASLVCLDSGAENNGQAQDLNGTAGTTTSTNRAKSLATRFFTKVHEIQLLLENLETRMYSASLLFVYEGDPVAYQTALDLERQREQQQAMRNHENNNVEHIDEDEDESEEDDEDEEDSMKLEELKLIDFAHADWTPGQGADENMLHGVRSVVMLLKQICDG